MLRIVNWTRKDWIGKTLQIILQLVIPLLVTMLVMYVLFLPMVEVLKDALPILVEEEFLRDMRDTLLEKGYEIDKIMLYMIFTYSGGVLLPTLILIWIMGKMFDFGNWLAKKIKVSDPIIYWNGVQKYPKVKTLKPDKKE